MKKNSTNNEVVAAKQWVVPPNNDEVNYFGYSSEETTPGQLLIIPNKNPESSAKTPGGPPGYLNHPARKQIPFRSSNKADIGFYNIWYHRYSGDFEFGNKNKEKKNN